MAAAPWYLAQKPGLKHQKDFREKHDGSDFQGYKRGVKTFQATKFRKGACENCGAMTHKKKDCVERPRKIGAKKDGRNIAPDELIQDDVRLGFEQKRDRYNGFDASDYVRVVDKFERAEKLKEEAAKKRELAKKFENNEDEKKKKKGDGDGDSDSNDSDSDSDSGARAGDKDARGFMKVTKRVATAGGGSSMTVRNLRIREDTAKYLRNLDLQSAYYDPKTRSMRENPTPNENPNDDFVHGSANVGLVTSFTGDNVNRGTGEAIGFERLIGHANSAYERGQEIHPQAGPSQAELLYEQFRKKKKALTENVKSSILDTYGDVSVKTPLPEGLLFGQTEHYAEYDRAGRLLRGAEIAVKKSRYEEDSRDQNHTAIWGSFWKGGLWGYACCRSHQKGSYCTGARGIEAANAAGDLMRSNLLAREAAEAAAKEARQEHASSAAGVSGNTSLTSGMKKPFGDSSKWGDTEGLDADVALDPAKLMDALRREDERLRAPDDDREGVDRKNSTENRRRRGGDGVEKEPTAEEMEAFRMKRKREEDPMAARDAGTDGYDLV